jgi:antitoxin ParD1/3/4/toxin ParE1/3/4
MKRFVLTRPAERDLDAIKTFLKERTGPEIARRVMRDLRSALELLASQPGIGHAREDLTTRPLKFWPIYSYLIVYDPVPVPVQIIRVLHGKRDIQAIIN